MEDICCPHCIEEELLGHHLGKLIDSFPPGAVHGRYKIWSYLLHLLNGWSDDWLKNLPREVKPTQDCVNLARSCNIPDMFNRIDDARMGVTVVLDTNIFLNVKNREEPYYESSKQVLDSVDEGRIRAVVSTVSIAELCVGYYSVRDGRGKQELILHLLSSKGFSVADLDVKLADVAGRIRAETGLRLPDAIIVASGLEGGAECIVTHDEEFGKGKQYLETLTSQELIKRLGKANEKTLK